MKIKNSLIASALVCAGLLSVPFTGLAASAADPGLVVQLQITPSDSSVVCKSAPTKIAQDQDCEIVVNAEYDGNSYEFNTVEFVDLAMNLVFVDADGKEINSVSADDIEDVEFEVLKIAMIMGDGSEAPLELKDDKKISLTKDTFENGMNLKSKIQSYGDFEDNTAKGVSVKLSVKKVALITEATTTVTAAETTTATVAATTAAPTTTKKADNDGPVTGDSGIAVAALALAAAAGVAGAAALRRKKNG